MKIQQNEENIEQRENKTVMYGSGHACRTCSDRLLYKIPGCDQTEFNYLENRGAAFGMLQNQKIFFVFIAVIFLSVIIFVLLRTPDDRKYRKLHILLTMIAAGAIGNMIDRLRFDYVVDFIYIVLINFPIFNVADMYVTFATVILIIQVLFVYKDNDFNFLSFNQKKFRELK